MKKLHLFNLRKENWELRDYPLPNTHSSKHSDSAEAPLDDDEHMTQASDEWGGPMARREIQAIYLISFFCLLRSDEVLKIRREHLILSKDGKTVMVTLPFRKTHKNGGEYLNCATSSYSQISNQCPQESSLLYCICCLR